MRLYLISGVCIAFVCAFETPESFGQNLIINGGFENPTLGVGGLRTVTPGNEPSGFGWNVTSGDIEVLHAHAGVFTSFEGNNSIDLTGISPGVIRQAFATVPGTTYSAMFAYANNPSWGLATATFRASTSDGSILANDTVSHGSSTNAQLDWDLRSPISFTASGALTNVSFTSNTGPGIAGGILLDDITVFKGVVRTVGSLPASAATATDNAFVYGSIGTASVAGGNASYNNLDLLGDSSYTIGSADILDLNNGSGTLYVGPQATFVGNGIVRGNILNSGLVVIPITRVGITLQRISSPVTNPGTIIIPAPGPVVPDVPIIIDPGPGGFQPAPGTAVFIGAPVNVGPGGGGGGGGGSFVGNKPVFRIDAPAVIQGTAAWDGSLEVTGNYTQTATGITRLTIAGDVQGETYSLLDVGGAVALDGKLQIVLKPELFGFLPEVGDSFDMILAAGGISFVGGDLDIDALITLDGATYLNAWGVSTTPFNSGFAGDPDRLLDITQDIFSYALVDGGNTLRITLTNAVVPEPSALGLLGAGATLLMRRRAKRQ